MFAALGCVSNHLSELRHSNKLQVSEIAAEFDNLERICLPALLLGAIVLIGMKYEL